MAQLATDMAKQTATEFTSLVGTPGDATAKAANDAFAANLEAATETKFQAANAAANTLLLESLKTFVDKAEVEHVVEHVRLLGMTQALNNPAPIARYQTPHLI